MKFTMYTSTNIDITVDGQEAAIFNTAMENNLTNESIVFDENENCFIIYPIICNERENLFNQIEQNHPLSNEMRFIIHLVDEILSKLEEYENLGEIKLFVK